MINAILSVELGALITADILFRNFYFQHYTVLGFLQPLLESSFFWLHKQKMADSEISCFPNEFRETHVETVTLKAHFSLMWRGLEFWPYKGKSRCFSGAIFGFCRGYTHGKHLGIILYVMCYQSFTLQICCLLEMRKQNVTWGLEGSGIGLGSSRALRLL